MNSVVKYHALSQEGHNFKVTHLGMCPNWALYNQTSLHGVNYLVQRCLSLTPVLCLNI